MKRRKIHDLLFMALVAVGLTLLIVMVVERWKESRSAEEPGPVSSFAWPLPLDEVREACQSVKDAVVAVVERWWPSRGGKGPESPSVLAKGISLDEIRKAGLSLKEAMYYEPCPDAGPGGVRCVLCPRRCILREGERGTCKVRVNMGGELRTLVYGKLLALRPDPIEKKPLFHVLPGSRALSLATVGCNLHCTFCQNWEISQAYPEKAAHRHFDPEQIVGLALRLGCHTIAYTYTEPTIFYEYMLDTAKLARKRGLRNLWITCGYINPEPLRELCKYLDAANVDLKGFSEAFYRKYCFGRLEPVLTTLKILKEEDVFFEITNLVIPGANDDPADIRRLCKWIVADLGPDTPLHFSRFFPKYKMSKGSPTPVNTLLQARDIAIEEGLRYVFIGNVYVQGAEDTRCPKCGKLLVQRRGYTARAHAVDKGRCRYCGTPIPGIWPGAEDRTPWPKARARSKKKGESGLDW